MSETSNAAAHRETVYLIERYWPGVDDAALDAALARLEHTSRGSIEHVGSLLVESDQVVFSVMRATSEEVLREANARANVPVDRVTTVHTHGFGQGKG